ncbi:uncharacterized protein BYT42DRAFT_604738 [Radiomyces spectabilis]|uniref:uncharacterized protein n=1 Tax=Radiomyces spectabilis TaxID=64574 RepID=UPI00221EA528|nr:uncharacterized protein BYT42DRAFT_604738 [Radiomyces spectabilis]KAI8379338.1 hypothetical protein BYT42DRAFT_604738 [Radiomyces spectabilis]
MRLWSKYFIGLSQVSHACHPLSTTTSSLLGKRRHENEKQLSWDLNALFNESTNLTVAKELIEFIIQLPDEVRKPSWTYRVVREGAQAPEFEETARQAEEEKFREQMTASLADACFALLGGATKVRCSGLVSALRSIYLSVTCCPLRILVMPNIANYTTLGSDGPDEKEQGTCTAFDDAALQIPNLMESQRAVG